MKPSQHPLPAIFSRIVLIGSVLIVALLMAGDVARNRPADGALPKKLVADHPLEPLSDFILVPGSVTFVDEKRILALFENPQDSLYAIVLFVADYSGQVCIVEDIAAYVFAAGEVPLSDLGENVSSIRL